MLISLNWIKEFVNYKEKLSPKELASLISLRIAEVEDVKIVGKQLSQVSTVKIKKVKPHPNADKLQLATINTGKEARTIVCGATNCREGIITAFADLGTTLNITSKEGLVTPLVIKKTKIRGVESTGMLCSEAELGLAEQSEGILELSDVPLGVKLSDLPRYLDRQDVLFEIDNKSLTHRPDLWSCYGFAREFQAIFKGLVLADYPLQKIEIGQSNINISIESDFCRRYSALEIKNITVSSSPQWLSSRLMSLGMNSINNIVDITNYILLELGQPMHSFDADKLSSSDMKVRPAKKGEKFVALDDNKYALSSDDLVISSASKVVALAGIMGGIASCVSLETKNIILESANFDSACIRRSSIRHNLRSDSSTRFEKSLDPNQTVIALQRAVQLILQVCPQAEVVGQIADNFPRPYPEIKLSTSCDFIRQRLGTDKISDKFIHQTLTALGFKVEADLQVLVPSWRATKDINIPEDIVEEVGRIYGYDNIASKVLSFNVKLPLPNNQSHQQRLLRRALTCGYGFSEVYLYPWTGDKQLNFYQLSNISLMKLTNPISEDAVYMRNFAEPHLLDSIAHNLKYFSEFKIFEMGRVYDTSKMNGLLPQEKLQLTGAIIPKPQAKSLQEETFYQTKALVLDLLQVLGINDYQARPLQESEQWVHPNIGLGIYRGKQLLAKVYKLHPLFAQKLSLAHNIYLFSIYLNELKNVERKLTYKIISKYPTVGFDVTVIASQKELVDNIASIIRKSVKKNLIDLEVFSIYQGENIEEGKKAVSFRLKLGSSEHTLGTSEVTKLQNKVMKSLQENGYPIK